MMCFQFGRIGLDPATSPMPYRPGVLTGALALPSTSSQCPPSAAPPVPLSSVTFRAQPPPSSRRQGRPIASRRTTRPQDDVFLVRPYRSGSGPQPDALPPRRPYWSTCLALDVLPVSSFSSATCSTFSSYLPRATPFKQTSRTANSKQTDEEARKMPCFLCGWIGLDPVTNPIPFRPGILTGTLALPTAKDGDSHCFFPRTSTVSTTRRAAT
ncbi:hypothetical protein C8R43DRAFT_388279 [Mycena crocata]|nr:hypothetical protein C8R43DRAFT_388279 [Mycena crocata]